MRNRHIADNTNNPEQSKQSNMIPERTTQQMSKRKEEKTFLI